MVSKMSKTIQMLPLLSVRQVLELLEQSYAVMIDDDFFLVEFHEDQEGDISLLNNAITPIVNISQCILAKKFDCIVAMDTTRDGKVFHITPLVKKEIEV